MRFPEGLVRIYREPDDEVRGRYVAAFTEPMQEANALSAATWPEGTKAALDNFYRLLELRTEVSRRIGDPLKARRALVLFGGRRRIPLPSATI